MNVTSSLERNYSRSAFIVAGVGVLTTGYGPGSVAEAIVVSDANDTLAASETASFAAALVAASAA